MRCLGRTPSGQRCKNEVNGIVCRHHRWQPWFLSVSTLSFLAVIAGLYQDVWKSILFKEETIPVVEQGNPPSQETLPVSEPSIPAVHDEPYPVARALLIREGWIPQTNHWTHGNTVEVNSGNGSYFWQKGYHELDYCSGTGYALCRFEFNDPRGNLLVVITAGEVFDGQDDRAKVFRVNLNPENEEGAYGDVLGAKRVTGEEVYRALQETRTLQQTLDSINTHP